MTPRLDENSPEPPKTSSPDSPFRALLLVLVLDMAIGLWLKLHKPEALPLFVVVNAPTIGVLGFFWPLLPKETTDRLGVRLAEALNSPVISRVLLFVGGGLFVTSLFLASISVELLDTSTATMVHVVHGSQDSGSAVVLDSLRLNRLTSPASKVLGILPSGQNVWLYSPTHVLFRDRKLIPWLPVRLQYPADFSPTASIAVLPAPTSMTRLLRGDLRLSIRRSDGRILAARELDNKGAIIGFPPMERIPAEDSARWHHTLNPKADPSKAVNVALALQRWLTATPVAATRPLRQGDTLIWDVRSVDDTSRSMTGGRLVLDAPLVDLFVKLPVADSL